jgi:hypothetical protein
LPASLSALVSRWVSGFSQPTHKDSALAKLTSETISTHLIFGLVMIVPRIY